MDRRGMEGRWSRAVPRGVGVPDDPATSRGQTSRDLKGINGNADLSGSRHLEVARSVSPAGVPTRQRGSDSSGGEGAVRTGSCGARVHPVPAGPCHRCGCASGGRRSYLPGEADQGASRSAGDGERKNPRRVDPADRCGPCLGRDGDGVSRQIPLHTEKVCPAGRGGQLDLRDRGDVGEDDHGSTR